MLGDDSVHLINEPSLEDYRRKTLSTGLSGLTGQGPLV